MNSANEKKGELWALWTIIEPPLINEFQQEYSACEKRFSKMGTVKVCWIVILWCSLMVFIEAQNATSPMDILNNMKMSIEAAGAGGLKLGPMGILGDMNGQFGVKVNKEQTSSATKVSLAKQSENGVIIAGLAPKTLIESRGSSQPNILKSCYGRRRYGGPIIIPIIVTTTAAPATTTTAAPN